eukprot:13871887-Alexandrium_andersonii.AAC.1
MPRRRRAPGPGCSRASRSASNPVRNWPAPLGTAEEARCPTHNRLAPIGVAERPARSDGDS